MHASSLENMQKCYENYICGDYLASKDEISVLDIGGANVNGSYADIFSQDKFDYVAADLDASEGVDLILEDPYKIPRDDSSIDVLISGQAFEHVEFFWLLFEEMARVIKDDGWIFLIAPSAGAIHRYPVDCYRFYPDAYSALAKYTNINLVEVIHDERGPWKDLVGIFSKNMKLSKHVSNSWRHPLETEINHYLALTLPVSTQVTRKSDDVESINGEVFYLDTLKSIHKNLKPRNYFEIGVRVGNSLSLATCPTIAIDPDPGFNIDTLTNVDFFHETSDYFFEHHVDSIPHTGIDLAFIDGMHLFEFVLRDFINIEMNSNERTRIVIDDIFPNNETQASRERKSQVWMGDVWKIVVCLQRFRPDLNLTMLDTSPSGLLIVSGLNRNNRTLTNQYNPIVREFHTLNLNDHINLILNRKNSLKVSDYELSR